MEKQVTTTEYVCDICGDRANGDFFMDMNVNNDYIDSFYCPLDLCKRCMENYERFLDAHIRDAMKFVKARRGELQCSEINKRELVKALKHAIKEDD
ncbi:hypothetical protein [Limosilactobacillus antri]|uniref:hypothetical protein n=1 Tax=Limosilactobacillus antri TaxID=227943 RepID=UPI001F565A47|nr:hypothetical protein [Limosilactobacillus antri]